MSGWPRPIGASAMNSEFALDPTTEDVIRFLRAVIERARAEGVPDDSVCGAMLSETVNILHEIYGPERAARMLRAAADLAGSEPVQAFRLN